MRLIVSLHLDRPTCVPVNHQELLQGVIYSLLAASDQDYARFLHDEGYITAAGTEDASGKERQKRFKLFVFSGLRAPTRQRRVGGDTLHLSSGVVQWQIASPIADFLTHCATGLLAAGVVRVGSAILPIQSIDAASVPSFAEGHCRFTCLTPLVAAVPAPGRDTARYLRPCEGDAFSDAVRNNLLIKYRLVHNSRMPADDRLTLAFDPGYLARDPNQGTKLIAFKDTRIVGALAPFTLSGSPDLLQLAWECGLGEKNSMGFGMIDGDLAQRTKR